MMPNILYKFLDELTDISDTDPDYPDQIVFVLEDASEVQKEYCKIQRRKGSSKSLEDEMIDLLAATILWFWKNGYLSDEVINKICKKYARAITRYYNKGEQ